MDSTLLRYRRNYRPEAVIVATDAKGSMLVSRYLLRLLCVMCSVFLAAACKPDVAANYTPPIIPVTFSISSDWHVSVTVGARITTFLGTFSLEGGVSAPVAPDSTQVSIVLQGVGQKRVYDLQGQGTITLCLNGRIEETISQRSVVITALSAPSQVNLLPGNSSTCPAASTVSASSVAVPSESRRTEPSTRTAGGALAVPRVVSVGTYTQGELVYFNIHYTDPDNDAEGFGFVGVNGYGWAEENHPFASPSYGIVGSDSIAYPFNEGCGTAQQTDSYVEAWIYDTAGDRSHPVVVHLACSS